METFDFDFHDPVVRYPEDGTSMQLGKSYVATTQPTAPPQRMFTLYFEGMYNYWTNGAPDATKNPKQNFYRLDLFYQRHRMHGSFIYVHPQYGQLTVKFTKPLEAPRKVPGAAGELQGFSVEITEQP